MLAAIEKQRISYLCEAIIEVRITEGIAIRDVPKKLFIKHLLAFIVEEVE